MPVPKTKESTMNSNGQMKKETRPRTIRRTVTCAYRFIGGATPSQRLRNSTIHLGQLLPSPPNSQPSPVEPSLVPPIHSSENGQEPRIAVINPATFCHLNVTSEGYFKTKKRLIGIGGA